MLSRGQRKLISIYSLSRAAGVTFILCAGYLFLRKSYIVLIMAEIIDITEKLNAHPKAIKADAVAAEVERLLADQQIAIIYRDHILTMRTRKYELKAATKPAVVEVLHTLLGIELKIGKRRLLCPDLATARYLSVFARLGVEAVAVPYDITQISRLADQLESAWFRMLTLAEHLTSGRSVRLQSLVRSYLISNQRTEIANLGAGTVRPDFIQNTKQRRR